ncbi:MAG TPA: hypothetical protein VN702_23465 [Acetobacteraceae bacterium]|nr:hypothetical protein [Acetobacteraceae bacterium]
MSQPPRRHPVRNPMRDVLQGILRTTRGRADGIKCFGGSTQSFLASLAPLIAFPLVGAGMNLADDGSHLALSGLLAALCGLLAPPVLSYEFARLWGRTAIWPRFATAFNWCQWALPVLAILLMIPLSFALGLGVPDRVAGVIFLLALGLYALWLHWFLARHGLELSAMRAALLVVVVNLGTVLAVLGPRLLNLERG